MHIYVSMSRGDDADSDVFGNIHRPAQGAQRHLQDHMHKSSPPLTPHWVDLQYPSLERYQSGRAVWALLRGRLSSGAWWE